MKIIISILLILSLFGCSDNDQVNVKLSKCTDGDTAHFIIDGKDTKVRFLAIDTPESVKENNIVEPFGKEASEYLSLIHI